MADKRLGLGEIGRGRFTVSAVSVVKTLAAHGKAIALQNIYFGGKKMRYVCVETTFKKLY